ncbi:unnamed protein product [Peniophora sp. CBMAI 1063]|nr:unnamed protein product [Peniophora sp. CBMAI 1063]
MHAALRSASRTALAHARQPTPVITRSASVTRALPSSSVALGTRGYASKGKRTKKAADSTAGSRSNDVNSGPADAEASAAGQSPFEAPPPPETTGSTSTAKKAAADAAANATPESTTPIPPAPSPQSLSLDVAPPDPTEEAGSGGRTGARSSKDSLSSIERRQRRLARLGMGVVALGLVGATVYMGREWESDELKERKLTEETAPTTRYGRTLERFTSLFDFFSKPAWTELLPPPLPAPHQKPYTLLVSIDDLLVTSTWDRQHGWRTAKRPGVDYFLAYLSQFYEIVIFTTQASFTAMPIVEKLDPYGFSIAYKLYRESTRAGPDGPVKDLSYLNRPLDKVILLDAHPEHCTAQPENAIIIKPWKGQPGDKGLIEMIPFLESIGIYRPNDIRPILKAYEGKDIPKEYAIKEAAEKKALIEDWKARGGGKGLSAGGFTFSSLFGGKEPKQAGPALPETFLERARREAQNIYLQEQKYLRDNKAEFDRLMKEDMEQRQKEMGGTIFGMMTGMAAAGAKPPGQEEAQDGEKPSAAKA